MTVFLLHAESTTSNIRGRMGLADYSYYFVLCAYEKVLRRLGKTIVLEEAPPITGSRGTGTRTFPVCKQIDAIYDLCRMRGEQCHFLSFAPPHKTMLGLRCPTTPVFAWEYEHLPNEVWDDDERNDWSRVLLACGTALTHSQFTVQVARSETGSDFRIASVPAPVWEAFSSDAEPRIPNLEHRQLDGVPAHSFSDLAAGSGTSARAVASGSVDISSLSTPLMDSPPTSPMKTVGLSGVVYTTVFNPLDDRKNWADLVRAFCLALKDVEDATLVLKTAGPLPKGRGAIQQLLRSVRPFACRVVLLDGYLDSESYRQLARASTFAVNASSGEGQCLPLMEFMSSGVPAIAPRHTAMAEYLDDENSFLVRTTRAPAVWPHDSRQVFRTMTHHPDIASLMDGFRSSYAVAKTEPDRYQRMSRQAQERLRTFCSEEVALSRLRDFFEIHEKPGRPGPVK